MPSNRNRTAGHNWEREVIKDLKQTGFLDATSSRYESKKADDAGVDIVNTGAFNIQCKNECKKVNYPEILDNMPSGINIVCHKHTEKSKSGRFVGKGKYVIMNYDDFLVLLAAYTNK